jgi:hypothetical protein
MRKFTEKIPVSIKYNVLSIHSSGAKKIYSENNRTRKRKHDKARKKTLSTEMRNRKGIKELVT